MATAVEYGLIGALISVVIIASLGSIRNSSERSEVLDPYGGPTFASAQEGLDSGKCVLGGVEQLPPPDTTGRWMCVAEDNPDDWVSYPTEALAASSGDCAVLETGEERLVLPNGDGSFRCEVHRSD